MADALRTAGKTTGEGQMRAGMVANAMMYALARGLSLEQVHAATGLSSADLVDPDGWVSGTCLPDLLRLLGQTFPDEAVALSMAAVIPLSHFGPLATACRHARDLRAALHTFIRYQGVLSDRLRVNLIEDGALARMTVYHPMDARDGGYGAELGLALGFRFGTEIMRHAGVLAAVELAHRPLAPCARYEDFFEVPVRFERSSNALVYHASRLDLPSPEPDPETFRQIQDHLEKVQARLTARREPEGLLQIRRVIASNAQRAEYGAEALARGVGMSLRKLQRLLSQYDTSAHALLDEAREAHARQLLSDPLLSVEDVAFLLGYSAERAFSRAFKRRTGQTPACLRRQQAAERLTRTSS